MAIQFGSYLLLDKLAVGGMAEIYLAKSTKISGVEKYLVIKRILDKYTNSQKLLDLFTNEAKINMNMSHSNIVSIFDFGLVEGKFYIAMEYVQGLNLKQLLKNIKENELPYLETADILHVVASAAKGLGYAHRCKEIATGKDLEIIHKDVSPDNILIDTESNVKIIDFGIAAVASEQKENNKDGKFAYMSPEQVRGLKLNQKTDIFSLGIVLWELLTQRRLYKASSIDQLMEKAQNARIPDISQVNRDIDFRLSQIVHKALKRDPDNRYETMSEFYNDLNTYLNKNYPGYSSENLKKTINTCYEKYYNEQSRVIHENKTNASTHFDSGSSVGGFSQINGTNHGSSGSTNTGHGTGTGSHTGTGTGTGSHVSTGTNSDYIDDDSSDKTQVVDFEERRAQHQNRRQSIRRVRRIRRVKKKKKG